MNWLLLTLLSVIISSGANILQKVLMKGSKSDPYAYAIIFHFLIGFINLIFAILHGFKMPNLSESIFPFLLSAFMWGMGTIFLFKALQLLEASEVSIINSTRVVITIIASIIVLNESFDIGKVIGTTLILGSAMMVTKLKKGFTLNKGILYALITSLFYGLAIVVDAFNLKTFEPVSYLAVSNLTIGLILLTIYHKSLAHWNQFSEPAFVKKMLILGVFSSTQAIAYYMALAIGKSSQIAPINQAGIIVTVLFAAIFLKERDSLGRKFIAAILVTIGVFLLK